MKIVRAMPLFVILTGVILINAFVDGSSDSGNASASPGNYDSNSEVAADDVVELSKVINLPFEPGESTVWRETKPEDGNGSPSSLNQGRKLVAVLKFESDQTNEIIKRAEVYRQSVPAEIDAESWFPAELVALSQVSGDGTLKGNSYAANEFVKTPYTGGTLTRIANTDYLVLELDAL